MLNSSQIESLIKEIKSSHSLMKDIFMEGSCMNLFCILKTVCPQAKAYYNYNHIITRIGDKYYDINGIVSPEGFQEFGCGFDEGRRIRAFNAMYNGELSLRNSKS